MKRYTKILFGVVLMVLLSCFSGSVANAQSWYAIQKKARKQRKKKFVRGRSRPGKQCYEIAAKKTHKNKKQTRRSKGTRNPVAEHSTESLAQNTKPIPTKPAPKPTPKPEPLIAKNEVPEKKPSLSSIPEPSSDKQLKLRKKVAEDLKKDTNEPKQLDPLYFTFDEDEFSIVDMEPFLVAVEYALQGKMILIEGHTDSRGADNYNVSLSIKRVEKIRKLMHDMGVPDDRISVVGYGEEVATHDNTTNEGRQLNRRVDFTAF